MAQKYKYFTTKLDVVYQNLFPTHILMVSILHYLLDIILMAFPVIYLIDI
ncbi:MAG: hypothetical protein LBI45_06795 [Bacteroidales bacterium]|jgi:hypothetical protein|nr:hypothetical protein [Bacteroidales bacterium]